jgi:hypothetical protein
VPSRIERVEVPVITGSTLAATEAVHAKFVADLSAVLEAAAPAVAEFSIALA